MVSARLPKLVVSERAEAAVRRGHPWLYREALSNVPAGLVAGDSVQLTSKSGKRLATGIVDPESPIAVRVWSQDDVDLVELAKTRIVSSAQFRKTLFADGSTTAYRILHGEGDRCPGLVVDRYADVAVLKPDGAAAEAFSEKLLPTLRDVLLEHGVKTMLRRTRTTKPELVYGRDVGDHVVAREHGVPFWVDVLAGQKTGAFLDQRENRVRLGELVRRFQKPKVLNLFSYTAGFSLRAALKGAHTTSVDVAKGAHDTAREAFRAAGVDDKLHTFVTDDAFAFLAKAKATKKKWDVVISDPPSFAPNARSLSRALSSYRSLHAACVSVLADGGIFCASSCSSHVDAESFQTTLDDASLARSDLRLVEAYGAPADHPTLPSWPEGRYLKFCVLA